MQIGLGQALSDWLRRFQQARSLGEKLEPRSPTCELRDVRLYIPAVTNRTTGMSMGEHTEDHREGVGHRPRASRTSIALASHQHAVAALGSRLLRRPGDSGRRARPRHHSARATPRWRSWRKLHAGLRPHQRQRHADRRQLLAADRWRRRRSGSRPTPGLTRLPAETPRVRLVDWEIAAVDFRNEGLLMAPRLRDPAPAGAQRPDLRRHRPLGDPRGLRRPGAVPHQGAARDPAFLRDKAASTATLGAFPRERVNPNGGSVALGHPVRRHRRAHPQPGGEGARRACRRAARHRQHLRRRRPGNGGVARGGLTAA